MTADTALRLGRYFNPSPDFWLGLQLEYDLRTAERKAGDQIAQQIKPMKREAA
ncbi:MAG: hypothetical protein WBY44_15175 [Bryobacteraceae bacterium]